VIVALLVVASGALNDRLRQRFDDVTYRVVVAGDVDAASDFLDALDGPTLTLDPIGGDAADQVAASEAAAGLELPADLDARIDAGEAPEIDLYYRSQSDNSLAALNELLLRLQQLQLDQVAADVTDLGLDPPSPTVFATAEVTLEPEANRLSLGPMLAAVASLLCLGVVTSAASAAGGGRDDRSIESLLVLPFRRSALATGTVAGVVPVSVLQLVAAVGLITVSTALPLSGLNQPPADVAAMLVVVVGPTVLLGVLAAAIGCLAGVVGAGSEDAVSIGDLLGVPFVAVAAAFFLAPETVRGPVAWLLPIVGPVTAIRDGVTGALDPLEVVAVTVAGVAWIALAVWLAAGRIGDERRVLRVN